MLRQNLAGASKKQLAELLFDEFCDIAIKRSSVKKSPMESEVLMNRSFQGDFAVADSRKRLSGTFKRENRKQQTPKEHGDDDVIYAEYSSSPRLGISPLAASGAVARGHTSEASSLSSEEEEGYEVCEGEVAQSGHATCSAEGPTDEMIHKTANKIADMGDKLDDVYKKRLEDAEVRLANALSQREHDVSYALFAEILSSVIPQDPTIGTYLFVMHLSLRVITTIGYSFIPYLRRYLADGPMADRAAEAIEEQQGHHV